MKATLTSILLLSPLAAAQAQEPKVLLRTIDDTDDATGTGNPLLTVQHPETNGSGGYVAFASFLEFVSNNQVQSWIGWGRPDFGPSEEVARRLSGIAGFNQTNNTPSVGGMDSEGRIFYRALVSRSAGGTTPMASLWFRQNEDAVPDELFILQGDPILSLPDRTFSGPIPLGMTQNGIPYFSATVFTTSGFFEGPGLFAGIDQQVLVRKGSPAPSYFPAGTTIAGNAVADDARLSALGNHWINASQARLTDSTPTKVFVTIDGQMATSPSGNPVFKDMPLAASDGGLPGETWNFFQRLGVNEAGDSMVTCTTNAAESVNSIITFNGEVRYREGDTYDFSGQAVTTVGIDGVVSARMNENTDIGYVWACSNGRQALFLNDRIVLTDQIPVDWDRDGAPDPNAVLQDFNNVELSVGDRLNGQVELYFLARVDVDGDLRNAAMSLLVDVDEDLEGFCNATGGACTACPCANDAPTGTIGGCINSRGLAARLEASGRPSLSTDTLRFQVRDAGVSTFASVNSAVNALPNLGPCPPGSGIVSPMVLDGLRCIGGSLIRHGPRPTDADGNAGFTTNGWGGPSSSVSLLAQAGFAAGQTRHFQCFYRQLATAGCGTGQNTSNAVSVTAAP